MRAVWSTSFLVSVCCWAAFEAALTARDLFRRRLLLSRDRHTRVIVALALGGSIGAGFVASRLVPALDTPAPAAFAAAGTVVIWAGLALRFWAVRTLGRSFRTVVAVDTGQAVVTRGPYRWVRHPSYTGLLLLLAAGIGIGLGNWLSLAICAVVPPLGLLPRIAVEESELTRVLGDEYRTYRKDTYRLLPGVW
jgi:protein-S-isoprenylcysteine O-methyltransferase Ste14